MPPKKKVIIAEPSKIELSKININIKSQHNKPCIIKLSGLSYQDIVEEHFCIKNDVKETSKNTLEQKDNVKKSKVHSKQTDNSVIDINQKSTPEYFFDSKKNKIKTWPVQIDKTNDNILALYTNNPCRKCHHSFDTHPIGCPIKYIPHISNKNDPKRLKIEQFLKDNNFDTSYTDYFEIEHIFCSFPCVKSYILTKLSISPSSYRYTNALTYLSLLYKKLCSIPDPIPTIPSAHDIDTIDIYGGHLSIDEYRQTAGILRFDKLVNAKRPLMFASLSHIEETNVHTGNGYL